MNKNPTLALSRKMRELPFYVKTGLKLVTD